MLQLLNSSNNEKQCRRRGSRDGVSRVIQLSNEEGGVNGMEL